MFKRIISCAAALALAFGTAAYLPNMTALADTAILASDSEKVEISVVKDQWSDGLYAASVPWQIIKPWKDIQSYGTLSIDIALKNLDYALSSGGSFDFTDLDVVFYGMDTTTWNWVKGGSVTLDDNGKASFTVDASTLNPHGGAEVQIGLQIEVNDQTKIDIDDKIIFDLDYTMTYVPVPEEDIIYTLPQIIKDKSDYAGDWNGDGYVDWNMFKRLPEGDGLDVTIKYTLRDIWELNSDGDMYSHFLAAPFIQSDGWTKLYSEGTREWIRGIKRKSSLTENEVKEHEKTDGSPLLGEDGYIHFYRSAGTDQELTFTLSPEAIAKIKETYEDDNEGKYGGIGFQVYGVNITEVKVSQHKNYSLGYYWTAFEMYTQDDWSAGNWQAVSDGGLGQDAEIYSGKTKYTVGYGPVYYEDETDFNTLTNIAYENADAIGFFGTQILCVDIMGLASSTGCSTKGLDLETTAEKQALAESVGLDVTNVKLLVDGVEVAAVPDDKVCFADIEGNGNLRIEVFNPGAGGETSVKDSSYYVEEVAKAANNINNANVIQVTFDITGVPENPFEPTDEKPEEPYEDE